MTRRHFFFGSLAFITGCARRGAQRETRVTVVRAGYTVDLVDTIRRILLNHRVRVTGRRILLKPNLVEFSASAPINTSPFFVAATLEAFRSLGADKVTIAEGPGHRRMTLDMADSAGYFSHIPRFERLFTDLNVDDLKYIPLHSPFSKLQGLHLPVTALDCDLLVTIPKMKTHHWTGATLSMKNLFGVVPGGVYGWPKNILHWAGIDECIADLHTLFPSQFCLVDGIEAMEGNGPILGTLKKPGIIIAGADPPSVDATCCRVMQIDPVKIKYLGLARSKSPSQIVQTGESIASVSTKFALHPDLEYLRLRV